MSQPRLGRQEAVLGLRGCIAAALGTMTAGTGVPPIVIGTIRRIGTTIWGFGWCVRSSAEENCRTNRLLREGPEGFPEKPSRPFLLVRLSRASKEDWKGHFSPAEGFRGFSAGGAAFKTLER